MNKKNIYFFILIIILYTLLLVKNKKPEAFINNNNKYNISIPKFNKPYKWSKLGFNDKLKLYGKQLNNEYSLFADKLKVKNYINSLNINNLLVPHTVKILNKDEDLNFNKLPKNCVIKSNCGSGDIIIIKNSKIIKMMARNSKIKNYKNWKNIALKPLNYKPLSEPHYKYIKPEIFVEEYLDDNIKDYKIFCINGKFIFCQADSDRFKNHCQELYDKDFNLLPFNFGRKKCDNPLNKPDNYKKMIKISEKISNIFEFCRVDLYSINNKIYLGELTFVPNAADENNKLNPKKYDLQVGKLWK